MEGKRGSVKNLELNPQFAVMELQFWISQQPLIPDLPGSLNFFSVILSRRFIVQRFLVQLWVGTRYKNYEGTKKAPNFVEI